MYVGQQQAESDLGQVRAKVTGYEAPMAGPNQPDEPMEVGPHIDLDTSDAVGSDTESEVERPKQSIKGGPVRRGIELKMWGKCQWRRRHKE